jgi:uncharacterized SAM-binding protein YcdF (DUF218 family)
MTLDAIVVLGCRIEPSGRPCSAAMRRADRAARAWREGLAPLVVVSGGRRWHGVAEADALTRYLAETCGVPQAAILGEYRSLSTRENAWCVAQLLRRRAAHGVGVVTCDWHIRRALTAFRAAGLLCEPLPAACPPRPPWLRAWHWLTESIPRPRGRPRGLEMYDDSQPLRG